MTASNAAIQHTEEAPAREHLPAPESNALPAAQPTVPESAHPVAEAIVPPEKPLQQPIPPQAAAPSIPPAPANDQMVDETVLAKAEKPLADYIGARISPKFTEDLKLNLREYPAHDKYGLELSFTGSALTTNSGLLGEQVLTALKDHPLFAELFANPETTPHAKKPHDADKANTLNVYVHHLNAEQYHTILHTLATPAPEVAHAEIAAETAQLAAVEAAHGAACACASCATAHAEPANAEHADATLAAAEPTSAAPTNIVASPVADQQMLKAANTNLGVVK